MAISAGSALLSAVGTGFTATGFVTAGSMFIGGTMLTHFLASTAIGAAINALTPKPTTPGAAGYTVTARGANLDHQIIYGETRVAGAVVADFLGGDGGSEGTRFLHRVQVMAGHEIESYEAIYMNSYKVSKWQVRGAGVGGDETIEDVTDISPYVDQPFNILIPAEFVEVSPDGTETVVDGIDYREYASLAMQLWTGADDQPASTKLIADIPNGQWTSAHRLRGRAYMYIRMGRDADGDNFPTGVPEITAVIKGRKVYDPRIEAHDPADKSTWAWSSNPALCIRDYLTQPFGLNEKAIQVDDALVATAASVCDQTADDGSTRYTCNGAFTTGIQPYDFLNSILSSMGGLLWYAQGKWRMKPAYWTAPTESFSEDDFRSSSISVSTRHSRKDNFNTVEGTFRGPKSNYALTTFPAVDSAASIAADGGTVSKIDLEMPFTDTPEEARRIARIVLERNRQQLTVSASFGLKAFRVQIGDVVSLNLARFGWVNKTFEVMEWTFGAVDQYDIQVQLSLREITENVFDEVDDGAVFELDNANVPSPLAGLAVTNLTAVPSGFLSSDGSFVGKILVSWDAIVNSNVDEYVIEWGRSAFNFADYGGEVTSLGVSPTARETFIFNGYNSILGRNPDQNGFDYYNTGGGSGVTQEEFESQLANSPEARAISGSTRIDGATNVYTIAPAVDDSMYSIRVKAINDYGTSSAWATVTVNTGVDDTIPNAPANLTAEGGYRTVKLNWDAVTTNTDSSAASDVYLYNIYRGASANPTTLAASVAGVGWTDSGLSDDTTYHYRVTATDFSGNESAYSLNASVTTNPELVDGADGASVLVVYADDASGSNQSLTAGSRRYVQYYEYTGTTPTLPVPGTFVLFVGTDGTSIWPIYADDAAGNGQSFSPAGKGYVTFYESPTQPTLPVSGQTFVKYVGDDGGTGARGPGRWNIDVDAVDYVSGTDGRLPLSSADAQEAWDEGVFVGGSPGAPVAGDQAWFFKGDASTPDSQSVWIYNGSLWIEQTEFIDGNLLVTGTITGDKIDVDTLTVKFIDNTSVVTIAPGVTATVGVLSNAANGGLVAYRNSSLSTGYAFAARNYTGPAGQFWSNINNVSGSGDAIVARNGGGAGSTAVDARSTRTGGGHAQIALTVDDGGYGIFLPATSADGGLDASGGGWSPFTGVHMGMLSKTCTCVPGDILTDHSIVIKTISDTFGEVRASVSSNQAGAIGVLQKRKGHWILPPAFIDKEATRLAQESAPEGTVVAPVLLSDPTVYHEDYDLVDVNAVGEGSINVCGENGDIARGDLIVTSSTPGKGMRQSDDVVRSYTVAKAREAVTFSSPSEVKMIACIYMCG